MSSGRDASERGEESGSVDEEIAALLGSRKGGIELSWLRRMLIK